jgi:hypothetical protein
VYDADDRAHVAAQLAEAFLAGRWGEPSLIERGTRTLGSTPAWLGAVVRSVLAIHALPPHDRPLTLAATIERELEALRADGPIRRRRPRRLAVPDSGARERSWPVREIDKLGDLAEWLGVSGSELDWFADVHGLERLVDDRRLRHYAYATIPRRRGPPRVVERPKTRLKGIQRRILREILDQIPAHPAAHGFTRGRSAATHAGEHVGHRVVVAVDLKDFFASVAARRVFGIFRLAGYRPQVAYVLTGLTTNVIPLAEWDAIPRPTGPTAIMGHHHLGRQLATPHLPQGAPTSPALANLAAFRLDRRLAALADAIGATYSRYADDLVFSGSGRLLRHANEIRRTIAAIVADEGFIVNERKSRLITRAGRQRVCGLVVNDRVNVQRSEYDALRAILHNAARRGPQGENRAGVNDFRAHLLGRIAWVSSLNPARGEKLKREFARITWDM